MRKRRLSATCLVICGGALTAPLRAQSPSDAAAPAAAPYHLSLLDEQESIYAPPTPPRENEGTNQGGVNFNLNVSYLTDYVYRGINHNKVGQGPADAPNLQFDGSLKFNLDRFPHPFIGLFVNVFNDDPVSRFQEVRPYVGLEWTLRPVTIAAGQTSYIFPEREKQNTQEIFGRITLDDSALFHSRTPVLSPYVYGAYDYDLYNGIYLEAGIKHDFPLEDFGVVLTAVADTAYVVNHKFFTALDRVDTGFQHYDVGLIATYSLNPLLNLPHRFGEWKVSGYLFYTDGMNNKLRCDTEVWGGVGITFDY